jgi:hypothetical protein
VTDVDRTRTNSRRGGGTRRGQTLHDYVAGISVFILAIGLVLGLLPSVVAPFGNEGAVEETQTGQLAAEIPANLSVAGSRTRLDTDNLTALMGTDVDGLRSRFGLKSWRYVNVSVTTLNGSRVLTDASGTPLTTGATAAGEDPSTAARVVQVSGTNIDCTPACRLVVRVW